jgi:hypothetical protein
LFSTEGSWEAHWRRHDWNYPGRFLNQWEEVEFGLLGVDRSQRGNPQLFIWSKENIRIPVSRDLPLSQQETVTFEIAILCETEPDKDGKKQHPRPRRYSFGVGPDPDSEVGYEIVSPLHEVAM